MRIVIKTWLVDVKHLQRSLCSGFLTEGSPTYANSCWFTYSNKIPKSCVSVLLVNKFCTPHDLSYELTWSLGTLTLNCWMQLTLVYWMGGSGIGTGRACASGPSTCCGLWFWFGPWQLHPFPGCCWWLLSDWEFMLACFPSEKDKWKPVSAPACSCACVCVYPYTVLHVCVNTWLWKLISGSLSEKSVFRVLS